MRFRQPRVGFCDGRLAFAAAKLKVSPGWWGESMGQTTAERAKELARNLMEILASYEEELMVLERDNLSVGQLRRAVGIAIAEACYLISDHGLAQPDWAPPAEDPARRTR
ncbi:MAG TPA: hypothetical protein VFE10_11950 [Phenylobacterium sp.]|jgi:hypothetical protein|nr:hypothetical protein [Phenylobacterium sp.]